MALCGVRNRRGTPARAVLLGLALAATVTGCQLSQAGRDQINVEISADGRDIRLAVPAGSTAGQALATAGLAPGNLDRTEPPAYTLLTDGARVRLVRVEERFRSETRSIPFDRQLLRNESLPEGDERLVQSGVNGQEELTYRAILEDGEKITEAVIKTVRLSDPVPEIVMVGSRSSLAPLQIPGRLAYLSGGNAWIMEATTANRRLVVNTGDLDGYVFELSADGTQLLFTRKSQKASDVEINTLWMASTDSDAGAPVRLPAANVVHFAGFQPDSPAKIAYSTVEPRSNAPGWQANNDLFRLTVGGEPSRILDAQTGGVYGWWGTSFAYSRSGRIAYSRPDGIGLVSQDGGYLAPLASVTPLQTHGDWAWAPGIAWGADSQTLFYVDHVTLQAGNSPEESPRFDLKAFSLVNNEIVALAENVGMFSSPSASPKSSSGPAGSYEIAFLEAIFPDRSEASRYRLAVMDRDGSDRRQLFPASDLPGLEPRSPVWAPAEVEGQSGPMVCVVYQGNLWLIDSGSGEARQITGDGLVSGVDWESK